MGISGAFLDVRVGCSMDPLAWKETTRLHVLARECSSALCRGMEGLRARAVLVGFMEGSRASYMPCHINPSGRRWR